MATTPAPAVINPVEYDERKFEREAYTVTAEPVSDKFSIEGKIDFKKLPHHEIGREPESSLISDLITEIPNMGEVKNAVVDIGETVVDAAGDLLTTLTGWERNSVPESIGVNSESGNLAGDPEAEQQLAEVRARIEKHKTEQTEVAQIDSEVKQVTEIHDIQEEIRHDIQGMSDEDFAEKAGYKNTGFRGFLRTVANRAWVSLRLIGEKLGLIKPETSAGEIAKDKEQAIGFQMGENEMEKGAENFGHFTKAIG